ncbi:MAG: methylenetetrahydrofolate reductase [NAD(P)H] [Planctomycetota bacterium]
MRIETFYTRGRPVYSFEFFPPKTDDEARKLKETVRELREMLSPDFVSVTYGAGGSTRGRTLELVSRIQSDLATTALAHFTCVGHTVDETRAVLDRLVGRGIQNVLALRGDPPRGQKEFVPTPGGFRHASDLVTFLRENYEVGIGAACYPEAHPESPDPEEDFRWTLHKVACGAQFLLTQLFFDNEFYFRFVDRARAAGLEVPIVPGIMPITNVSQIQRFTKMCGASIPEELAARLQRYEADPPTVMAIGIEHAIRQCRRLLDAGVPGIHFYTLNKSHATRSVLAAIKEI